MVVLDTSAVLAVLLEERGAENVIPHMRGADMSIVNVCEVLTKSAEHGGDVNTVERILTSYHIRVRAFRIGHALEVARLRPLTQHLGLGLGDRACLAQGTFSRMPVLTADKRWSELDLNIDIRLIR